MICFQQKCFPGKSFQEHFAKSTTGCSGGGDCVCVCGKRGGEGLGGGSRCGISLCCGGGVVPLWQQSSFILCSSMFWELKDICVFFPALFALPPLDVNANKHRHLLWVHTNRLLLFSFNLNIHAKPYPHFSDSLSKHTDATSSSVCQAVIRLTTKLRNYWCRTLCCDSVNVNTAASVWEQRWITCATHKYDHTQAATGSRLRITKNSHRQCCGTIVLSPNCQWTRQKKHNVCFLFVASTSRGGQTQNFESPPFLMSQQALMTCCYGSRLVQPPTRCLRHPLAPLRTRPVFMWPLQQSIRFSRKLKMSVFDRGRKPSDENRMLFSRAPHFSFLFFFF